MHVLHKADQTGSPPGADVCGGGETACGMSWWLFNIFSACRSLLSSYEVDDDDAHIFIDARQHVSVARCSPIAFLSFFFLLQTVVGLNILSLHGLNFIISEFLI